MFKKNSINKETLNINTKYYETLKAILLSSFGGHTRRTDALVSPIYKEAVLHQI